MKAWGLGVMRYFENPQRIVMILLMEEILHHLGCIKPGKQWDISISTGGGFLPSTVL